MKPATLDFSKRTVGAFASLLTLAGDRLNAAVKALEADDLAEAAEELHAAATIAHGAADGAGNLAGTLVAEVRGVRP